MKESLFEAFQDLENIEDECKCDMLNISINDIDDINDFKIDDENNVNYAEIIDPTATNEEEIKDSYVGCKILKCPVCNDLIYKKDEEIEVNEDGTLVNEEDMCPNCGYVGGFAIVGKVAPMEEKENNETPKINIELEAEDKVDESLNETHREDADERSAEELELYIVNDREMYDRYTMPTCKNMARKMKRGVFDKELAKKAFLYVAQAGAKKYMKEFASDLDEIGVVFNPATRELTAEKLLERYEGLIKELAEKNNINESIWATDEDTREIKHLKPKQIEKLYDMIIVKDNEKITDAYIENGEIVHIIIEDEDGNSTDYQPRFTKIQINKVLSEDVSEKNNIPAEDVTDQIIIKVGEPGYLTKKRELEEKGYKRLWSGEGKICMVKPKKLETREKIKESKQLNEGAGAGYDVKGEIYDIKVQKILGIETDKEWGTANIKVDATGKFSGFIADYYNYGAKFSETNIKLKEIEINSSVFYDYFPDEYNEDFNKITVDDLNDLLDDRYLKIQSDIIGAGWSHKTFTGKDIKVSNIEESSYTIDSLLFDFVDDDAIEDAEYALANSVYIEDGEEIIEESKQSKKSVHEGLIKKTREKIKESFNRVSIETDKERMTMDSDENGKVTVTTEPLNKSEEVKDKEEQKEMIVPVNDEEEDVDIDIDEIDEESFDELGENYMKSNYNNVKSYKTTEGRLEGNNLVLEGLITFKSGKKAKTNFIFEGKEMTKTGKLRFVGENKQFAKGKKSFGLIGKLDGKKLVTESLTYNHKGRDARTGLSKRIYGTVNR